MKLQVGFLDPTCLGVQKRYTLIPCEAEKQAREDKKKEAEAEAQALVRARQAAGATSSKPVNQESSKRAK